MGFNVIRTTVTFKISALLALRCERFLLIKNVQLRLFQSDVSAAEAGQTNTQTKIDLTLVGETVRCSRPSKAAD